MWSLRCCDKLCVELRYTEQRFSSVYSGFKKRANHHEKISSPTAGITCSHGDMQPDLVGGKAKRVSVSPAVLSYIVRCVAESNELQRRKVAKARQLAADEAVARSIAECASADLQFRSCLLSSALFLERQLKS